jgi:hypothetical protein
MKCRSGFPGALLLMALIWDTAYSADASPPLLVVTNSRPGSFEVVSHRMDPVGAGIVIAGLIGAAVQSGVHSSQDEAMKKRLLPSYPEASCNKPLLEAFSDRIRASGKFTLDGVGKADEAVDIEIGECGFHLDDSAPNQFTSYVYFKIKVKPTKGAAWNEAIQISGRNRHDFEELVNQPGLAKSEMEDALKRAGTRAADKIIYKQ